MPVTATIEDVNNGDLGYWGEQEADITRQLADARQRARRLDVDQEEAEREVSRLERLLRAFRGQRDEGRASMAWRLRANGATYEEIAAILPRYDHRGGVGVSKPRAQQIVRGEAERRLAEARTQEEVHRIAEGANMRALEGSVGEALERVK